MPQKFTKARLKEIVETQTNNTYTLISVEAKGSLDPKSGKRKKRNMTLKHNTCGHTYSIPIYEFTDGKRKCAKCKGKVLRAHFATDIESIKQETLAITEGTYAFVDETYSNSKTKHKFKHLLCKTVFKKKWEKFKGTPKQAGQRCPNCQRKGMESMTSLYTQDILEHFNIPYEKEKRFVDCTNPETGMVLPFDYYLPQGNVLIEIDGEQHVRGCFTSWDVEGTIKRDGIKNKYAKKNGITLVRVPAKEWSALPKFLFDILSKYYIKNLSLAEVEAVKQSSRPESINRDLKKIHKESYALHDNFYTGSERKHANIHLSCKNVFKSSYAEIKANKHPCPQCRKKEIQQNVLKTSNASLLSSSKGRYTLVQDTPAIDDKGRRLVHCQDCRQNWRATVANLLAGKTGCPTCAAAKIENVWDAHYVHVVSTLRNKEKLNKQQKHWVWRNKDLFTKGKLKQRRMELLQKAKLNLLPKRVTQA